MKSKKVAHDFSTCAVVGNAATMKGSGVVGGCASLTRRSKPPGFNP
jgi:hypothetical protein